jgi:hypothetical protein
VVLSVCEVVCLTIHVEDGDEETKVSVGLGWTGGYRSIGSIGCPSEKGDDAVKLTKSNREKCCNVSLRLLISLGLTDDRTNYMVR